jgi:hypothetical protein
LAVLGLNNGPVCPRQGRRKPTPKFCAIGAGGISTVQTCVGGGAPVAKLRPATRTRRSHIAGRDKAAPLNFCRVVLLLLRKRCGASDLGELQWARGRKKMATAPAHTQRALHGAHSSRG